VCGLSTFAINFLSKFELALYGTINYQDSGKLTQNKQHFHPLQMVNNKHEKDGSVRLAITGPYLVNNALYFGPAHPP
jgi:hypothetical protein